jgi:hypothetical protein
MLAHAIRSFSIHLTIPAIKLTTDKTKGFLVGIIGIWEVQKSRLFLPHRCMLSCRLQGVIPQKRAHFQDHIHTLHTGRHGRGQQLGHEHKHNTGHHCIYHCILYIDAYHCRYVQSRRRKLFCKCIARGVICLGCSSVLTSVNAQLASSNRTGIRVGSPGQPQGHPRAAITAATAPTPAAATPETATASYNSLRGNHIKPECGRGPRHLPKEGAELDP